MILRQILSAHLTNNSKWSDIRLEFAKSLSLFINEPIDTAEQIADEVFPGLVDACSRCLAHAITRGSISTQALVDISSKRMLTDELDAVQLNSNLLSKGISFSEIEDFERRYRKQIGMATRFIVPPDTEQMRKIPIDDLYVSSDFVLPTTKKNEAVRTVDMSWLAASAYRTVILGNPGGGKSTFVRKLSHDLATRYEERLFAGRRLTPVLITLRDYGTEKKVRGCSIIQFLELRAQSDYQLPNVPEHAFDYFFLNGRALVLFDGLDELLDTRDRQKISQDVELFADLYPAVPIMITSREVGYEQAPLDDRFDIVKLSPFTVQQTSSYVSKWFAVNSDLGVAQRNQKVQAFMNDSQIVSDLRSNPLMLALMCILYRGEGYIPKNRPDVYKRCAEMLFEKWDKGRGIIYTLPFESHVRPAMHYLADWIYSDQTLQGGVSEDALVRQASKYLKKWCFEDAHDAESAARQFIEFCRGRAWVFTDTGTKKGGERLYQFTHRTFLEYFTAVHMVKTHRTPSDLIASLLPHIKRQEWDNVAQLAFQLQSAGFEGDADELLDGLLLKSKSEKYSESFNIVTFVAGALHYLVPTPSVRRKIVQECISKAIEEGLTGRSFELEAEKMLGHLLHSNKDNVGTVKEEIISTLATELQSADLNRAAIAAEIGLQLGFLASITGGVPDGNDVWNKTSGLIRQRFESRLREIADGDLSTAVGCVWSGIMTIKDLTGKHGLDVLFFDTDFRAFRGGLASLAGSLLQAFLGSWGWMRPDAEREDRLLAECGDVLLKSAPPWVELDQKKGKTIHFWGLDHAPELKKGQEPTWSTPALFGAAVLLATIIESYDNATAALESFQRNQSRQVAEVAALIRARYLGHDRDRSLTKLSSFSDEQRHLLSQWIDGSVHFVNRIHKRPHAFSPGQVAQVLP